MLMLLVEIVGPKLMESDERQKLGRVERVNALL
jgi:hypothetical protein